MVALNSFFLLVLTHLVSSRSIFINDPYYGQPEQIHISYGLDPSLMIVTWVTLNEVNDSVVEYGQMDTLENRATGWVSVFQDSGNEQRREYIHRVVLQDLLPGRRYFYHCGSDEYGWSPLFWFTAMRNDSAFVVRAAVYGDMGKDNAQSMARLQEETQRGHFDMILHVGDMAYDMDDDNARVGDQYMNSIQSIASYIPYMTCPGNHENAYNFSQYAAKFSMPSSLTTYGGDANHFYSFNVGPMHVIGFSTEFYYYIQYGYEQIRNQYEWLERDLIEANKPENRARQPWIVTMGHRPMYCSNNNDDECLYANGYIFIRLGIPFLQTYGLEDLFARYGVDLEFWAHEHSYERHWPVYNLTIHNGTEGAYIDPDAPVHIVTGSAGCGEHHDPFGVPRPWTAFQSDDYGYTRMNVFNATHMYLEQVSDDQGGKVIDQMWLIKSKHGPYSYFR